jgi:NAD-dependent dihydropyrimidine dehydrogenase PreA subunit/flavodoxin
MDILILYESCTGNTQLGVEVIRRTLDKEGHTCTVKRFHNTDPGGLEGYDLYCFATPIQSFAPLTTVHRFIKAMSKLKGRPAFIFTTGAGWPGIAHRMMAGLLRRKGMTVLGAHLLACPDNWPIGRIFDRHFYNLFTFPRKKSLKRTKKFALEMVNKAYRHRDGIKVKAAPHILWPTPTLPLGFFAVRGALARAYGKRTVDEEACTRCGICVETCPVGAVSLQDLPVFDSNCIGCWACFNNCPTRAILTTACSPQSYYGGIEEPEKLLRKVGL